jgi:hypothetical protein
MEAIGDYSFENHTTGRGLLVGGEVGHPDLF